MRLTHLTKYAALAGALATPLAFAAPASATTGGTTSAFGVAASGLVTIPQTPAVSSTAQPNNKSLAELPPNPLVTLKVLHVTATPGHARASVVDLKVAQAQLSAHLITARCEGGKGSSHLVKASLAGHRLAVDATPNSIVSVPVPVQGIGTVSVVLNKQVRNADGGLTVTAIEMTLPIAAGKTQTVSISSATCNGGSIGSPGDPGAPGDPTASPSPSPTSSTPPGEAPTPTPVPGDLPVTG